MMDITYFNTASFFVLNHAALVLPDWFWASLTITGHTSMVFALLTPLLLVPRGRSVLTALLVCAVLGGLVATLLKESFQLPRPPAVLSPESFHLIGHKLELVSFPSGHTLTAFAVATLLILGLGWRSWKSAVAVLLASAIGLSRIAVGAHWPLDVVFGAIFGFMCAYLSLIVIKWSFWRSKLLSPHGYQWLQIGLFFAVSLSLFQTDMGYPQAIAWQYVAALFGVMMSSYAAILHLKQSKRF